MRRVLEVDRLVTCSESRTTPHNPLGVVEHARVVVNQGRIECIAPAAASKDPPDEHHRLITPGLVDAHTHAAWMGSRHDEYAMRMAGADYRAIAAQGGGIVASHRAITKATEEEITETLTARLRRMAKLGVTTVEVKSGYGLEPEEEYKQLRAIARVAERTDVPRVVSTFLALHALTDRARPSRDDYVRHVADVLVPEVARAKLARFVDAYIDANAFTIAEGRMVAEAARAAGLGVRLHVGQFADVGGAELCAELGAKSADHLENVSDAGIDALARAGVTAILLPVASFTLGQAPPPVSKLRARGVAMAVASDANPGTAPTESLPLAMALAVRLYGLTPSESFLGATRIAARSLQTGGGMLEEGAPADFVSWELPHEHALVQPWGVPMTRATYRDGIVISS